MKTEFFLTLPLKNSEMICLNLGLSLHVPAVHTPQKVLFAHAASFFLRSAKKLGKLCLNLGLSLHVLVLKKNPYSINTFFLIESTHYEKSKSTKQHTTNDD